MEVDSEASLTAGSDDSAGVETASGAGVEADEVAAPAPRRATGRGLALGLGGIRSEDEERWGGRWRRSGMRFGGVTEICCEPTCFRVQAY